MKKYIILLLSLLTLLFIISSCEKEDTGGEIKFGVLPASDIDTAFTIQNLTDRDKFSDFNASFYLSSFATETGNAIELFVEPVLGLRDVQVSLLNYGNNNYAYQYEYPNPLFPGTVIGTSATFTGHPSNQHFFLVVKCESVTREGFEEYGDILLSYNISFR